LRQSNVFLKTFTVGFDLRSASGLERSFDERAKAEFMSYLFKTEHYEMILKSGDMERCLKNFTYHLEEPRVGQSYPNYYAAKLSSKFVKVVLSGIGGDELFAGYPWRYFNVKNKKNFDDYIDENYRFWQRLIPNKEIKKIFSPIANDIKSVWTRDILKNVFKKPSLAEKAEDYINHSLYFEAKTFLHGLLVVEDKLSMAHSIETRVPFLDNDLVDFSQKIPVKFKIKKINATTKLDENEIIKLKKINNGKMILRKSMTKYMPKDINKAVKQGFSSPDQSWFKGDSIDFVKKKLLNEKANIYKYLDKKTVQKIINQHLVGKKNRRLFIWSLLNFESWINIYE
jgi:asparagine synthase (glutamine-hydrolysing)